MGERESKLVAWLWRKIETAAVLAALVCVWVWINSPPRERARRRPARDFGVGTSDLHGDLYPEGTMFESVQKTNHAQRV